MTTPLRRTDRRGALRSAAAAALAAPLLAACDATDITPPRSGRLKPTTGAASGDAALVSSLGPLMSGLRVAATGVAKHSSSRRAWALDLAALHEQHLRKLGVANGRATRVPAGTPAALASAEHRLQQALVSAAARAQSGALAQVLASMAAAVGQRLVAA